MQTHAHEARLAAGLIAQVRRVLQVSGLETDNLAFDSVEEALAGSARLV
jgi:hypothetical protein